MALFARGVVVVLLLGARAAAAETIFATDGETLFRFDTAAPEALLHAVPIEGAVESLTYTSLELDPTTGTLYGFTTVECLFVCPPMPALVQMIDPWSGQTTALDWPGQPLDMNAADKDLDPTSREFRILNAGGTNLRFSLDDQLFLVDTPLDLAGDYLAIAHAPPGGTGSGVETFAVRGPAAGGFELVRLGGPGGAPPAASGEVHPIGTLAVAGTISGFDISTAGVAYLVAYEFVPGAAAGPSLATRLYAVELATAAVEELGLLGVPSGSRISGIAVAPDGLGAGVVAVPALSTAGLAVLAIAMATVGALLGARRRLG